MSAHTCLFSRLSPSGVFDGLDDLVIACAAAQIAGDRLFDFVTGGFGFLLQQHGGALLIPLLMRRAAEDQQGQTLQTRGTTSTGYYRLSGLETGSYTVTVAFGPTCTLSNEPLQSVPNAVRM